MLSKRSVVYLKLRFEAGDFKFWGVEHIKLFQRQKENNFKRAKYCSQQQEFRAPQIFFMLCCLTLAQKEKELAWGGEHIQYPWKRTTVKGFLVYMIIHLLCLTNPFGKINHSPSSAGNSENIKETTISFATKNNCEYQTVFCVQLLKFKCRLFSHNLNSLIWHFVGWDWTCYLWRQVCSRGKHLLCEIRTSRPW